MSPQTPIEAAAVSDDTLNSNAERLWKNCHVLNRSLIAAELLSVHGYKSSQKAECINSGVVTSEDDLEAFKDDPSTLIECKKGFDVKELTLKNGHLVSKFERDHYYYGVYPAVLKLLYRSDLETNPFPHPSPGDTQFHVPVKTMGAYQWRQDIQDMKYDIGNVLREHAGVVFEYISISMFSSRHADGSVSFSPLIVQIDCDPENTGAVEARVASLDVLRVVKEHNLPDFRNVAVEWVEWRES